IKKSVYIVLALGGVTVFPLALIAAARKTTLVLGLLLVAIAMWLTGALHYSPFERILFAVFSCAGFTMVSEIVRHLAAFSLSRKGDSRAAEEDLFLGV